MRGLCTFVAVFGIVLTPAGYGQRVTGEIVGSVQDASQAPMPGIKVTVTHDQTKASRVVTTDGSGFYRAPTLEIGTYTVEAGASGFKTMIRRGIELHVNDVQRVDFTLEVGTITEQITVEGEAPVVSTETGEISNIVSSHQVVNLPLNGRVFTQLGMINPGVNQKSHGASGGFSANGLPTPFVNIQMDSGEIMDFADQNGQIGVLANFAPSLDSIAEFTMQTSSYSAQYGKQAGANVNIVTKSGTNQFHGTAFHFFRNQKFDARNFFSAGRPRRLLNQYGGTLGGPIVRDKVFFFFSFEGTRKRVGLVNAQTVPTEAQRRGDFSALLPGTVIRDPDTMQPFPNNRISADKLEPLAIEVLNKVYPLPNSAGTPNFREAPVQALRQDQYLPKIDWQITPRNRVSGRYILNNLLDTVPWAIGGSGWCGFGYPGCSLTNDTRDQNIMTNVTSTISPTLVSAAHFMWMRRNELPVPIGPTASRIVPIPELSTDNILTKMPTLSISGFASSHVNNEHPHPRISNVFKWSEHMTWISGRHTFNFGGDLARLYYDNRADSNTNGNFSFNGSATGYALADFLTGRAFSYQESLTPTVTPESTWRVEPYFEDRVKLTPRLTLGLGLRWSLYPSVILSNDRNSNFSRALFDPAKAPQINPSNGALIPGTFDPDTYYLNGVFIAGQDSPYGRRIVKTRWNNFGPRVDFAWDPTGRGKMSIRGGAGAFYDAPVGNYYTQNKPPFNLVPTIFNTRLNNPGGGALVPQAISFNPTDEEGHIPTVWTWNFGVERELFSRAKLGVTYVANHGYHVPQRPNINQPFTLSADVASGRLNVNAVRPYPGYATLQLWEFSASSKYQSLQVLFQRHLTSGLQLRAAYTFSKTTTVGCDSLYCSPMDSYNYNLTRGLAGQDVPHIFVASYVWQIPAFRNASGWTKAAFAGWTLSGITSFQSGNPLNIGISPDRAGNSAGGQRPNITGEVSQPRTVTQWFDTSVYSLPALGTYGNLGYNAGGRTPGVNNWDLGIHKQFDLRENVKLEYRAEWFNLWNHTQFAGVGTTFGSSTFGRVTSARDARIGQMALKLIW
jgi:hypothetical protein